MFKIGIFLIILLLPSIVKADRVVLVFSASWCNPCQQFKKTLYEPDIAKLLVQYNNFYVDIDTNPELKKQFGIKTIPTVVIINEEIVNGKEVETVLYKETYPRKPALKNALIKNLDKKQASPRPLLKIFEKPVKFLKKTLDN